MIDGHALGGGLRSRRTLGWCGVLVAITAILAFIPLFDVVGFEMAFVIAVAGSLAGADLAATMARRMPGAGVVRTWLTAALANLVLIVPPLLLMLANGWRVRACDRVQGLIFYAYLPGLSILAATTVGVVVARIIPGRSRWQTAAVILFVLGSLVVGIQRFYNAPAIFAYDPFAGYFPGSLYDENIQLGWAFFWSRVYQATICMAALTACAALGERRVRFLLVTLVAGVAAAFLYLRSGDLGFAPTSADIAEALGGRRETPHFIIYYPKTAAFAAQMDAIAADHEFRWAQVARAFGVAPAGKITSFYFGSADEKARWMGAANTYVAKPWRHEIYLSASDFPHSSLRHEIAHVFAGEFGDPLFHVSVAWWAFPPAQFNVGLIEGAAVAADWPGGFGLTPDQASKAMLELNRLPPLAAILAPGFFAFSSAQSYTIAGSFCHFLIAHYGVEKFRALYRKGGRAPDFLAIYAKSLKDLEAEWREVIDAAPLGEHELEAARERYRQSGIFTRPCPHAIADAESRARILVGHGEPDEAARVMQDVCRDDPGEPLHRLSLAGILERAHHEDEAAAIYKEIGNSDKVSPVIQASALLRLIDLLGRRSDIDGARPILAQAMALPVDDTTRRNLGVRALAFGNGPEAVPLRAYLFARASDGGDPDSLMLLERAHGVIAAAPQSGLGHYLAGRILAQRSESVDAAAELGLAAQLGLDDPLVARENDRLLVAASFLAGDLTAARVAAARLAAPDQPPGTRAEGEDWLERCRFVEAGRI